MAAPFGQDFGTRILEMDTALPIKPRAGGKLALYLF